MREIEVSKQAQSLPWGMGVHSLDLNFETVVSAKGFGSSSTRTNLRTR